MSKIIKYEVKQKIIELSWACFWYWQSLYSFLDSCWIPKSWCSNFDNTLTKYALMRNILNNIEEKNMFDLYHNIISWFYGLTWPIDKDKLDIKKAKILLNEFKELVWKDPIEEEINRQKFEEKLKQDKENIMKKINFNKTIEWLKQEFYNLASNSETNITNQKRWFELEKIIIEIIRINELEHHKSYKTISWEQIDWYLKFDWFDYLIESKREEDQIKQKDLSIFDWKIKGKAQSTRWIFISISWFDKSAIMKFSSDNPRIILFDWEDIVSILEWYYNFCDILKMKNWCYYKTLRYLL